MLVNRKPRKRITCSEAAKRMGYRSSVTIKRKILSGEIKGVKMGTGPTSPWLVYEAEIEAYIDKRVSESTRQLENMAG
jgi:hypothetical protein